MQRLLLACLVIGLWATPTFAQTSIAVPFDTATFQWTAPTPSPTQGAADAHVITCGTVTVTVPMPSLSAKVKDVVSTPGAYTCTLYARNVFGASPSVSFPAFQAGYVPPTPTSPVLIVP